MPINRDTFYYWWSKGIYISFQAAGEAPRRPQAYVTCPHISVTLRMALRPDAAIISRKRMIKFLKPSGRGPGPGIRGTADGYSPDIARTGPLRLRLRLCHKYNNFKSSIQMYIMSTNAEHAEMTIANLLVDSSARNKRCLEPKFYELKSIFSFLIIHELWNALKCNTKFRSKFLHGTYAA